MRELTEYGVFPKDIGNIMRTPAQESIVATINQRSNCFTRLHQKPGLHVTPKSVEPASAKYTVALKR